MNTASAEPRSSPLKIVSIYILMGGLWIVFSDTLMEALIKDPAAMTRVAIFKGWGYVGVTAWILYLLINRYSRDTQRYIVDLNQTGAALREREVQHRLMLEQMGAILWTTDGDLRFTSSQGSGLVSLNLVPGQMVGQTVFEYFQTQDQNHPIIRAHRRALEGDSVTVEQTWGGRTFQSSMEPLRNRAGEIVGVIGISLDITERKRTEAALQESESGFRALFETMTEGCALHELVYDGNGAPLDYRIVDVNPAYEKHTGLSVVQARNSLASEFYGTGSPPYLDVFAAVALTGEAREFETYFAGLQRHFRISVSSPKPGWFATVFEDITDRKRAEERLQEQSARLANLSANVPGIIYQFVVRPDGSSSFLYVSDACRDLLGVEPAAALADPLALINTVHPDERPAFDANLANAIGERQPWRWEGRCLVDGRIVWAQGASTPRFLPDGSTIWDGVVMDLTPLKQAEEALQEAQARLRLALESAGVGSWDWNITENTLSWDDHIHLLFGLNPGTFSGGVEDFYRMVHPEDRERVQTAVARALEGLVEYDTEYRVVWPDDSVHHISARGRVYRTATGEAERMTGICWDVTARRWVEQALRESEKRYRLISENSGDVIWTLEAASGRFTYVSPSVQRLRGFTPEEVIAQTLKDALTPESYQQVVEGLAKRLTAFEAGDESMRIQTHLVEQTRKDGTVVPTEVVTSILTDEWGRATEILGVTRDISERKKLEAQLQQAQKIESIGRLAGGVAHDFNNVLGPILGYAELLLAELAPDDPRHEKLEHIRQAGLRARDLTRQLLAFGRKQLLALRPVDLRTVISGFEKLLRRTVREDIRIDVHLPAMLGTVRADVGQIEQVLMNLAVNAQDAMPEGGVLTLELAEAPMDEAHAAGHQDVRPGPYVVLSVSDTGVGMDKEILENIFEPFYTTKELGKGTGLGLSTVYGIVKQHGGSVWVYSEPGWGSKFKIYLPVVEDPADKPETDPVVTLNAPRGKETVVIVEDNEMLLDMARHALERQGYRVIAFESAVQCLDIAAAQEGPIDLLLTDVVMPGMNGRQLYEQLAAVRPGLKVLYMSGYTDDVIAHRGMLDEGVQFIQKPFSVQALAQKVRELLDTHAG